MAAGTDLLRVLLQQGGQFLVDLGPAQVQRIGDLLQGDVLLFQKQHQQDLLLHRKGERRAAFPQQKLQIVLPGQMQLPVF